MEGCSLGGLSGEVARAFYGRFQAIRTVQRTIVEPILHGEDALLLSPTGSGKTEAILAPLVQRHMSAARNRNGCVVLHVVPTRALANDLLERVWGPLEMLGWTVGIRHGERDDFARVRKPSLTITTPESLDVLLTSRASELRHVRAVVLDELHLLYNTQRGFQCAVLLKRLAGSLEHPLQVAGLSATVARPADVWRFFRPCTKVAVVESPDRRPIDYRIDPIRSRAEIVEIISALGAKRNVKILMFCNSRRECDSLASDLLNRTPFRDRVFAHHSSLDRGPRLEAERAFKEPRSAVCVATSTLELGIDIGDIDLVMLYGNPGGWEPFLQRIGRGNRRGGKSNVVCMAATEHQPVFAGALGFLAVISQVESGRIEQTSSFDVYGAAVQQICSVLSSEEGSYVLTRELAALFSPEWSHLDRTAVEKILEGLAEGGYVRRHGYRNGYAADDWLHRMRDLRLLWGNYPLRSREISLHAGGRAIGSVPYPNLLRMKSGTLVRFAGRHWVVRRIRPDGVDLEPSRRTGGMDLSYRGTRPTLDPSTVEEMLLLLTNGIGDARLAPKFEESFRRTAGAMRQYFGIDRLPFVRDGGLLHYFTFAGQVVNAVIGAWAGLPSEGAGELILSSPRPIDFSALPPTPSGLADLVMEVMHVPENLTFFQSLLPASLLEKELLDFWLKTPAHLRGLSRLQSARVVEAPPTALDCLRA